MENDDSAVSFDTITRESGQFGFFQKRLFLINTLIQSACVSVLLYTCACMPEIDQNEADVDGQSFIIVENGYHEANFSDNNKASGTASLPFTTQESITSPVIALDEVYQNISNIASIFINNTSMSKMAENTASNPLERLIEKLKDAFPFTFSPLDYFFENVTSISAATTTTAGTSIMQSETFSTQSRFQQISDPQERLIFEENLKLSNGGYDAISFSLEKALDLSSISELSEIKNENYTSAGPYNVTYVLSEEPARLHTNGSHVSRNGTFGFNSVTTQNNSTVNPAPIFILLRKELKRTLILENLSLEAIIRVTSYAQGISVILGALVGSMMADIFGRKRLLYISLSCMLVLHCLVALSFSWVVFIFFRAAAVGCAGATIVISFVTVVEFVGPDWRDACTCSCLWTLGAILVSLETVVTLHWRWLALLSGGICLPLIATYFTSMESLRWLQCQHRFTEAEWGFREMVTVNTAPAPDILALLDQSRGCIVNNMHVKKFTYFDLFHSLDSTKWTITLVYTCTISSAVYFCLLWRVREITSISYINGSLPFVVDLPLTWSVIVMNRCLGRRWCLFLYAVASGFALLSVLVLHLTGNVDVLPSLVTGLALFGKIGVTASMAIILVIATEVYPTVTRCMGVSIAVASASAGSMLVNALSFLEQYHYTVPFVAYGAMMSSVGFVGLNFPETIRRPLKNVQQCRHRKIPLMEGARLVGRPPGIWNAV